MVSIREELFQKRKTDNSHIPAVISSDHIPDGVLPEKPDETGLYPADGRNHPGY